jgi:hypothetical protein
MTLKSYVSFFYLVLVVGAISVGGTLLFQKYHVSLADREAVEQSFPRLNLSSAVFDHITIHKNSKEDIVICGKVIDDEVFDSSFSSQCVLHTFKSSTPISLPELQSLFQNQSGATYENEAYSDYDDEYAYVAVNLYSGEGYGSGKRNVYAINSDGKDFKEVFSCDYFCENESFYLVFFTRREDDDVIRIYRTYFKNGEKVEEEVGSVPYKNKNNGWVLGTVCRGDPCISGGGWAKVVNKDLFLLRFTRLKDQTKWFDGEKLEYTEEETEEKYVVVQLKEE